MLVLPLPPTLNNLYRPNFHSRGVRKTPECEAWQHEVQLLARHCRPIPKPQRVVMDLHIYYRTERDIDSSSKALNDVLQGYMYDDDRQISEMHVWKEKDSANPRLEVSVRTL